MLPRPRGNLVQTEEASSQDGEHESRVFAASNGGARDATASVQELIELARQGDTAAFGELIQRHYSMCLKRASSFIRNPTDAEDEVQNACWKASSD
jgi:DNA-binding GntR family transcriptional regulator